VITLRQVPAEVRGANNDDVAQGPELIGHKTCRAGRSRVLAEDVRHLNHAGY